MHKVLPLFLINVFLASFENFVRKKVLMMQLSIAIIDIKSINFDDCLKKK